MLPSGQRKKPFEYDHAAGCVEDIKAGDHVRVCPWNRHMQPHPHADKTGIVRAVHANILQNATILVDKGFEDAGRIMIVSLTCLEKL